MDAAIVMYGLATLLGVSLLFLAVWLARRPRTRFFMIAVAPALVAGLIGALVHWGTRPAHGFLTWFSLVGIPIAVVFLVVAIIDAIERRQGDKGVS